MTRTYPADPQYPELGPYTVTSPDNGGPYTLSRALTRGEMLNALSRCQTGEASCLFTLKLFEAHLECILLRENEPNKLA